MYAMGNGFLTRKGLRALVAAAVIAAFASPFAIAAAYADPPPWAPANGYRAKVKDEHGRKDKHERRDKHKKRKKHGERGVEHSSLLGIDGGRCNRDVIGGLIGAAAGAALGSRIGKGDGQMAAIIGGAVFGALVGGSIGRSMDRIDQNCIGQALEHAGDGRTVAWRNPDADASYRVTPREAYKNRVGQYCREYTTVSIIGGQSRTVHGTACRMADGSWKLES